VRWRRNELDVQFGLAYLGLVFIWPYAVELPRMLAIVVPMMVFFAWVGLRILVESLPAVTAPVRKVMPVLLALILPIGASAEATTLVVRRALAPMPEDLEPYMRSAGYLLEQDDDWARALLEVDARVRYAIQSLPQYMPANECVYSISPQRSAVYGHRYSERMPTEFHADQDARAQFSACRYLLITLESTRQANEPLYYPMQHIGALTEPVFVSSFDSRGRKVTAAMLVRFRD
jgi:hypothetical protein